MSLREALDARTLAEYCRGRLVGDPSAPIAAARADSRLCGEGDLFVALPGEAADGHEFIPNALANGASVVLADAAKARVEVPAGKAAVLVDDPLRALQEAAREWRRACGGAKVVAVTGSNGKTTTKNLIAAILESWAPGEVFSTPGNYNSDIGLPLALLSLRPFHRYAVLEMGMNRKGEIAELVSVAKPDVAVVTNVGVAHIGLLGSREAIAAEKRAIFAGADVDSTAVVPRDDDWKPFLLEGYPGTVREFGPGSVDFGSVDFHLPGKHNASNAAAAAEAARALGIGEDAVREGLSSAEPAPGRSEIVRGAVTVIRDCYNANPDSLAAALDLFGEVEAEGRRILVLGELLELGSETEGALREAGGAAARTGADAIFLFGKGLETAESEARVAGYPGALARFDEFDALEDAVAAYVRPGDLVLLKGSRGSALERLDAVLGRVGTD